MTTYPYEGWVLTHSYDVAQRTFVRPGRSGYGGEWLGDVTADGRLYRHEDIHPSAIDALAAGSQSLESTQSLLNKKQATLDKYRAALLAAVRKEIKP